MAEDMSSSDDASWWMFSYKVQACPIQERHDWSTCPNAHRGERAARRCPRAYSYAPEPCPEYSKTGTCPKGPTCPLAHSVFESWLHPSRFRTQLCCFGASCKRRICFFAHDPAQLRVPTQTPSTAAAAAAAAASGVPVLRRTQAVVPASVMGAVFPAAGLSRPSTQAGQDVMRLAAAAGPAAQQQQQQLAPVYAGQVPATAGTSGAAQQALFAGLAPSWLYTSAGWVQAAPAPVPGQAVLMPMAAVQHLPQQQQQQQHGGTGSGSIVGAGSANAAAAMMSVDAAMLSGLTSGLQGLVLQEQGGYQGSSQPLACTMLPASPSARLLYQQQGAGPYAAPSPVGPAAPGATALMYAPTSPGRPTAHNVRAGPPGGSTGAASGHQQQQ